MFSLEVFDLIKMHMQMMESEECYLPKHHLIVHPILESLDRGNPWFYAAWLDESLNKDLKAACKNASQLTFEFVVLNKMREILKAKRGFKRRRALL